MNGSLEEGCSFLRSLCDYLPFPCRRRLVVCPSFPYILPLKKYGTTLSLPLFWGGQNCSFEERGPHTGEVSAPMLRDIGCDFVLLGHRERYVHENEHLSRVKQKIFRAQKASLQPIVCFFFHNTNACTSPKELLEQLEFFYTPSFPLTIAYEPTGSIGTGHAPCPQAINKIFSQLKALWRHEEPLQLLYGGSVTEHNAFHFLDQPFVDGLLIGKASLSPSSLGHILCGIS